MTTLGDLLYTKGTPSVLETEWCALVGAIASADSAALDSLYTRAHRLVYTFLARGTASTEAAEQLTLDVFRDIVRYASRYDPGDGTVLCWIMNMTRFRSIGHSLLAPNTLPGSPDASGLSRGDLLQPSPQLRQRVGQLMATDSAEDLPAMQEPVPKWTEVTPGIFCQLLTTDAERHRVSMLLRLLPGIKYPPHTHSGREEVQLLQGELWIDDRRLHAGDYNRAEAHTRHGRVWSATGCTCLLHTSTLDTLD